MCVFVLRFAIQHGAVARSTALENVVIHCRTEQYQVARCVTCSAEK